MAKYYNNLKKTGKLAGSVFAIRYGETIERAYNPVVANPRTTGQIEARAKMKLMSQLAAVLGANIAIPRQGAKSSRNLFVKKNYSLVGFNNLQADINLNMVQLTTSVIGMPALFVERTTNAINVHVASNPDGVSRVVYVGVMKRADNTLSVLGTAVSATVGDSTAGFFPGTLPATNNEVVVLAYGVRDNNERARATFGNLQAVTAEAIAKLIVERTLLETDVTLTETVGTTLVAA